MSYRLSYARHFFQEVTCDSGKSDSLSEDVCHFFACDYWHSPDAPFLPDFGCAGSLSDVIIGFFGGILGANRRRGVFWKRLWHVAGIGHKVENSPY